MQSSGRVGGGSSMLDTSGFSLTEVIVVSAIVAIMAGIALPGLRSEVDAVKLSTSTRSVQSELQTARLKAVQANTYMRVRFDCPAAGQFRMVELIGSPFAADTGDDTDSNAATRCALANYPYIPNGADGSRVTKPNNDGQLRYLDTSVTFSAKPTIEFWPDGTAYTIAAGARTAVPPAGVTITLARKSQSKTITVTSLGNIQMQR
jgi:prepilin-type N-terminal cleavage/methylation domain-containing protein